MRSGIYMIQCISNSKVYVGSSSYIARRWQRHKNNFKMHRNTRLLQLDYDLYGEKKFIYAILETCPKKDFIEKESFWINYYESSHPTKGYNIKIPNKQFSSLGNKTIRKIYSYKSCYKINKFTGETILISYKDINFKPKVFHCCLSYWSSRSKHSQFSHKDYIYVREKEYDSSFDYINYKKPRVYKEKIKRQYIKKIPKPYSERNLFRVPIKAVCVSDGKELVFNSIASCTQELQLKRNKVDLVLSYAFKVRSHRGYWLEKIIS